MGDPLQAGLIGTGVFLCGYLYRTEVGGQGWPFLLAVATAVATTGLLAAAASLVCVRLAGVDLTTDRAYYFFALAVTALVLAAIHRLRASHYGHSLRLIGFDRRAASALGVSPWRYKLFAFAICGVLGPPRVTPNRSPGRSPPSSASSTTGTRSRAPSPTATAAGWRSGAAS